MKIFHGSDHILKTPVYLGGKSDNDYGNGFYITEGESSARNCPDVFGVITVIGGRKIEEVF